MREPAEQQLFPYRPIPFYYITTRDMSQLTYEKFYESLSDMKSKGYGGVIPFNRPPEGFTREGYFSEDWFTMMGNCIRACSELGLRVWINDDYDCPTGDFGGRLEKLAPHLRPLRLRLEGGTVSVEEVSWGFPAYEHPESAPLFQKYVYEEYKRRFGQYFGNTVVGFFSDADARRCNSDSLAPGHPMRDYFPWTRDFAQSFAEVYGYDVTPYLPSILRREPSSQSRDYWEHNGRLYFGWFASNYRWCRENGLEYTFHTSDCAPFPYSRTPFNSAFAEGKAIDAGINCDWPGTDHETLRLNGNPFCLFGEMLNEQEYVIYGGGEERRRAVKFYDVYADLRAKQAQSCAFLNGKKGVMCEMYATVTWSASYKELRNILSWQLMQGVTFAVLQAYHYRIHRGTKNFAPLSFGPGSHTDFDMRAFNDALADNAFRCARGRLRADLALLDSTDAIWAGTGDSETQLRLAKHLNRMPQGYVIADLKGIWKNAAEFRAVVDPGLPLTQAERDRIAELGLLLIGADEAFDPEALEKKVPTGIRWEGPGQVMFMRRVTENGEEMLVVGNIESDSTLQGAVRWGDRRFEIELTSGELAFLGGPWEKYRSPSRPEWRFELPPKAEVSFSAPNVIPLHRWENGEGKCMPLRSPQSRIPYETVFNWGKETVPVLYNEPAGPAPRFCFRADSELKDLRLLVSRSFWESIPVSAAMDGRELSVTGRTRVLDDEYLCLSCPVMPGGHVLTLGLSREPFCDDALFLQGEFDVSLSTAGPIVTYGGSYSVRQYLPRDAEFVLSARRSALSAEESWTEQGQPFYSGSAEYRFEVELPRDVERGELVFPSVREAVKVWVDGSYMGSAVFPPYRVPVKAAKGSHTVSVLVGNTLGNQLEGYRAASGIMRPPVIEAEQLRKE